MTYTIHATETHSVTVTQPGPTITVTASTTTNEPHTSSIHQTTAAPQTTQAADPAPKGSTTIDDPDDDSGALTVIPVTPSSGIIFVTKYQTVTSWEETKTETVTSWKETTTETVTATTTAIRIQLVS